MSKFCQMSSYRKTGDKKKKKKKMGVKKKFKKKVI